MSRRAAIVEEFDDDTDLPLPSLPLPNTGSRAPLLQELHISDDEFEPSQYAGPASPPRQGHLSESTSKPSENQRNVTDITPYKTWTCIYPIYLDAKRPYGPGQRRVERAKSLWWPLSKDIADAANQLGLGTLHEVNKSHPRDWDNPGRVRVQWKKDGRLINPIIKTKKQLLEVICFQLQHLKPENVPKPPYNTTSSNGTGPDSAKPNNNSTTSSKGKQPAAMKSKSPAAPQHQQRGGRRLPVPPEPHPPLASRLSTYSPAISTGVLIETVKAGMNATENSAVGAGPGAPPTAAAGKGKRKVVRVRG